MKYIDDAKLKAMEMATIVFASKDGSNNTSDAKEFTDFVDIIYNYLAIDYDQLPTKEPSEDQGEDVLGYTKESE